MQKKKRHGAFENLLPHIFTMEPQFQLILKATVQGYNFCFLPFLAIGHVTILLTAHWINPDSYNHPYVAFLHFFGQTR